MFIQFNKSTNRLIINILGLRLKFQVPIHNKHFNEKFTNLLYELADPRTLQNINIPKVLSINDSLQILINSEKSLARFGDGEFKLIMGENINFQKADKNLSIRLKEILQNNSEDVLIGIPDTFGYCPSNYFRKVMVMCRESVYQHINFQKEYCNAELTRQIKFQDQEQGKSYYEAIKKLWQNKEVVIVEGAGCRLGIGNDLFSNTKSIKRIICPIKDAYSKYTEILNECKKVPKTSLFIIALGPTATVLAYDLSNAGYRALDVGHIDTMYECFLRKSEKLIPIEGKIVFNEERRHKKILKCTDDSYYKSIIAKYD